jgi:FkbM family methyltransferase
LVQPSASSRTLAVAIEPSAQNYASLVTNIGENGLSTQIIPLAIGLGADTGLAQFTYSSLVPGSALHWFGAQFELAGNFTVRPALEVRCLCMRMDDVVKLPGMPFPTHIKIDVDGTEFDVLRGSHAALADPRCRSVQVEVVDEPNCEPRNRKVIALLSEHGFTLTAAHDHHAKKGVSKDYQFEKTGA